MSVLDLNIKKLGFGLMRLPMDGEEISYERTCEMVDAFIEGGYTYFDTAFGYNGGKSEEMAKRALVDRYPRESYQIATKLPSGGDITAEEMKQRYDISIGRLGCGYIDFYLMHCITRGNVETFKKNGIWEFFKELKAKGLVKHIGFSMHDDAEALEDFINAFPEAEFVQLQINYIDWESESIQSRKIYEVARKYNKPVIIMEPVKGGNLATLSDELAKPFKDMHPEDSASKWALRYANSLEGVVTILSGMSNIEQMNENLDTFDNFEPITEEEQKVILEVTAKINKVEQIPCTDCRYCVEGCPVNIQIPNIIGPLNTYSIYGNLDQAKEIIVGK